MEKAKQYTPPIVLRVCEFSPEGPILDGSLVDDAQVNIAATEQKVETHDFSDSGFNHNWQ